MDLIKQLIDLVLHLDQHLVEWVRDYGVWTYAILFLIIFCETGLVVTPFLPGDSLLFAVGALAAKPESGLDVFWVFALLSIAAILGDTVNYWVGKKVGPKVFHKESSRFFNKQHLERTHQFYEKYGGKTIIIARFIPIIRTFAPVVAGMAGMPYRRFAVFNIIGGIGWVFSMTMLGYLLVTMFPATEKHIEKVIVIVVFLSVLPAITEWLRARSRARSARS